MTLGGPGAGRVTRRARDRRRSRSATTRPGTPSLCSWRTGSTSTTAIGSRSTARPRPALRARPGRCSTARGTASRARTTSRWSRGVRWREGQPGWSRYRRACPSRPRVRSETWPSPSAMLRWFRPSQPRRLTFCLPRRNGVPWAPCDGDLVVPRCRSRYTPFPFAFTFLASSA